MCGINGILGKISDAESRIVRMNQKLAHRGPDAGGVFSKGPISLGHRRLSIIDLSEAANQPMSDPSGRYTLVFNGEIYNYRELRGRFKDHPFKTDSDTEVLLAGLIRWGSAFLKECVGMFAFAFWDGDKEELLLARDRMGIKPLYYARIEGSLIFSSEIRPLIASGLVPARINESVLGEFVRYQTVHGTNTLVDGVFVLPAGSFMVASDEEERIDTYWHMVKDVDRLPTSMAYSDVKEMIRSRFEKAVERRLIADVPFGAFLSGGIDSSSIVAVASQYVTSPLRTFTVVFDDDAYSEAQFARIIAERYQTDHQEIRLSPNALIHHLPDAIAAMDHPSGDGINTYVVSKAAKEAGITMVLSGLGGDELFAGYPVFKQISDLQDKKWLLSFPKWARRAIGQMRANMHPGVASQKTIDVICEDYFDVEYAYQYSREVTSKAISSTLLSMPPRGMNSVFDLVHDGVGYGTPGFQLPLLSRITFAEMSTYMHSVLLRDTDQMSMASALEVRVPFLDNEFVQTVMAVPDRFKYPRTPKSLFVDSMGDLLPDEIVKRPKMGFTFPWDSWMRKELKDFCGDQMSALGKRPQFNEKAVNRRWEDFLKGDRHVTWSRIWYLCILEAWLSKNEIK
jgi:asparagine synthase (glutamine-hydrolysing)